MSSARLDLGRGRPLLAGQHRLEGLGIGTIESRETCRSAPRSVAPCRRIVRRSAGAAMNRIGSVLLPAGSRVASRLAAVIDQQGKLHRRSQSSARSSTGAPSVGFVFFHGPGKWSRGYRRRRGRDPRSAAHRVLALPGKWRSGKPSSCRSAAAILSMSQSGGTTPADSAHRVCPVLQQLRRHLAVQEEHARGTRCLPPKKLAASGDGPGSADRNVSLAHTARRGIIVRPCSGSHGASINSRGGNSFARNEKTLMLSIGGAGRLRQLSNSTMRASVDRLSSSSVMPRPSARRLASSRMPDAPQLIDPCERSLIRYCVGVDRYPYRLDLVCPRFEIKDCAAEREAKRETASVARSCRDLLGQLARRARRHGARWSRGNPSAAYTFDKQPAAGLSDGVCHSLIKGNATVNSALA